ncbi:MAG: 4Fe-4S dicluster domain-containing protein [Candidatus Lokiarchaeota archaeon]|nr:4Fe-4S dicluster domain-containing protein [Candidatus Lokiarchaeota archaeon]MBD3201093.1 4Fe-4S dicluster domain-containing protein [Candidatus Lokiarchaeota archaeon]
MPKLVENKEKNFVLFLNKQRCGGCNSCITVCPTGILEQSDELNMRLAYIPIVKEGKAQYCTGCRRCELGCPDWAIYVLDEENENSAEMAKT